MNAESERRRYTRVAIDIAARIHVPEGPIITGNVEDLSLGGVRMSTDDLPPDGARCAIELDLPGDGSAKTLVIAGALVRASDGGAALEFRDVAPAAWDEMLEAIADNEFDRERLRREAERAA
jgi:c-di-GMP-binding flagellar brake protein YcgR